MKTCYIMVGVSGAGKSTAIHALEAAALTASPGAKVKKFSLDTVRVDFALAKFGVWGCPIDKDFYAAAFKLCRDRPKEFDEAVNTSWAAALKADIIFVDNTNLTKKSRARWINDARNHKFKVVGVMVMATLDTVVNRQDTRGDKAVPKEVVVDMYNKLQELYVGFEVDDIIYVDGESNEHQKA